MRHVGHLEFKPRKEKQNNGITDRAGRADGVSEKNRQDHW